MIGLLFAIGGIMLVVGLGLGLFPRSPQRISSGSCGSPWVPNDGTSYFYLCSDMQGAALFAAIVALLGVLVLLGCAFMVAGKETAASS